jgi:hypothetical protein
MRQCLFCDSTKLTKEHIWPNWVVRIFKAQAPPRVDLFTSIEVLGGKVMRSRKTSTIEHQARIVCADCNHGWMSEVEHHASKALTPLILGSAPNPPRRFRRDAVAAISTWLTLRSIVFDRLHPPPNNRYFSDSERQSFRRSATHLPLPNTHVWLGLSGGLNESASWHVRNVVANDGPAAFHVTTGVLHYLIFQLVTWRGDQMFNLSLLENGSWPRVMRHVWPMAASGPSIWPPERDIDREILGHVHARFDPDARRMK